MQDKVLLSTHIHNSVHDLINYMISCCLISQMWSHWLLSKLLEQDVDKTIENSGSVKELFELLVRLIRCLLINIVD
jgi:hypothetical protein